MPAPAPVLSIEENLELIKFLWTITFPADIEATQLPAFDAGTAISVLANLEQRLTSLSEAAVPSTSVSVNVDAHDGSLTALGSTLTRLNADRGWREKLQEMRHSRFSLLALLGTLTMLCCIATVLLALHAAKLQKEIEPTIPLPQRPDGIEPDCTAEYNDCLQEFCEGLDGRDYRECREDCQEDEEDCEYNYQNSPWPGYNQQVANVTSMNANITAFNHHVQHRANQFIGGSVGTGISGTVGLMITTTCAAGQGAVLPWLTLLSGGFATAGYGIRKLVVNWNTPYRDFKKADLPPDLQAQVPSDYDRDLTVSQILKTEILLQLCLARLSFQKDTTMINFLRQAWTYIVVRGSESIASVDAPHSSESTALMSSSASSTSSGSGLSSRLFKAIAECNADPSAHSFTRVTMHQ